MINIYFYINEKILKQYHIILYFAHKTTKIHPILHSFINKINFIDNLFEVVGRK